MATDDRDAPHHDHDDDQSAADAALGAMLRSALHELPDAPAALQRAAIGLWPVAAAPPGFGTALQAALKQIVAVLSFDSWAAPALAHGMRSLRSPSRQLLYSAGGVDVDLRIVPTGDVHALAGQLLGAQTDGRIELAAADGAVPATRSTPVDDLGEFHIGGLARGSYTLRLVSADSVVELPPFQVGDPPR